MGGASIGEIHVKVVHMELVYGVVVGEGSVIGFWVAVVCREEWVRDRFSQYPEGI